MSIPAHGGGSRGEVVGLEPHSGLQLAERGCRKRRLLHIWSTDRRMSLAGQQICLIWILFTGISSLLQAYMLIMHLFSDIQFILLIACLLWFSIAWLLIYYLNVACWNEGEPISLSYRIQFYYNIYTTSINIFHNCIEIQKDWFLGHKCGM